MSIASFNVQRESWNDTSTVEAVGAPDADVVCLQEVTFNWERVLRSTYAARYPYMLFKPLAGAGGMAVLSRFPLEDGALLDEPHGWHPAWRLEAHTPAGTLQILNVHLRALVHGDAGVVGSVLSIDEDHRAEIELFYGACDPEVPTVIAGDFNESPSGAAIRFLEERGFENALPLFRPGQETWRAGHSLAGQLRATVDHILFDSSLEPLDARIFLRGNSDHLPVLARFEAALTIDTPPPAPGEIVD